MIIFSGSTEVTTLSNISMISSPTTLVLIPGLSHLFEVLRLLLCNQQYHRNEILYYFGGYPLTNVVHILNTIIGEYKITPCMLWPYDDDNAHIYFHLIT